MRYQCQVTIHQDIKHVTQLFIDHQAMLKWQKGLEKVEVIKGTPGQSGSVCLLHYRFNHDEMVMKETIELNELPQTYISIYELGDAWNRCNNTFKEENGKVIWTMNSEFKFKEEKDLREEDFINKTKQSMNIFKEYIEKKKQEHKYDD